MRNAELSSINGLDKNGFKFEILKLLVNPDGLDVHDHVLYPKPNVGDHIKVKSFDNQIVLSAYDILDVINRPFHVVTEVIPVIVSFGSSGYYWIYDVHIQDSRIKISQWHYEIIACPSKSD